MRKRSFPAVVDDNTRLLVLGSLPGEASLAAGRYYAHPRNGFWRLMGAALSEDLVSMDYEARLATLLRHGVGLWDVVAEAERRGSLDADIQNIEESDLRTLVAALPRLRAVAFNGGTSAKIGMRQLAGVEGLELVRLPSSSPAYAGRAELKMQAWSALRRFLSA